MGSWYDPFGVTEAFSSEKTKMKLAPEYAEAGEGRKWLLNLLQQGVPNIPTRQIPGLTGTELGAQDMLSQYLGSDLPESFRTALDEMTRIATEPIDITKLPEFEPIISRVGREGDIRTNRLMRRLQMGGALSSSPGGKMIGRETSRTMEEMAGALAPYAESERGRRFAAMMGLPGMAEWEEGAPVRRMGAVSAFGGLPRQIETEQQQEEYIAEIMRIMFPYQTQGQIAEFLAQLKPEYYSKTTPRGVGWDIAPIAIKAMGGMG